MSESSHVRSTETQMEFERQLVVNFKRLCCRPFFGSIRIVD